MKQFLMCVGLAVATVCVPLQAWASLVDDYVEGMVMVGDDPTNYFDTEWGADYVGATVGDGAEFHSYFSLGDLSVDIAESQVLLSDVDVGEEVTLFRASESAPAKVRGAGAQ